MHILSAAVAVAVSQLYREQQQQTWAHMSPCKQESEWLAGRSGGGFFCFTFLEVLLLLWLEEGWRGWPVPDCLRLSYRGALEEAVCLHTSLYLHRLWLYIKFRALP